MTRTPAAFQALLLGILGTMLLVVGAVELDMFLLVTGCISLALALVRFHDYRIGRI